MNTAIVPSTFLLTLLLSVGLFFFIRASTKDRTEKAQLLSEQDEATFMTQLKEYFRSRSYRVISVDKEKNQVTFEGFVRPSWFLAIFLTVLAAVGLVCLSLVLSQVFSSQSPFFLALVLLSPVSGIFYWQKAGRLEQVSLKMETIPNQQHSSSIITVIAHRDEIAELQSALQLKMGN
ncbi:cofactor assembly of complex C subunit B [Sphaerospermopsis aphanizomenoides BCCUSP55]|uniref:cofactor assembly of complex C subunit B n=1 Tax=Sphaerospermopsis aphanizomenoides TaxID=459663 RepID=UPI000AA0B97C|nr:cofactor assembly of complex C subunit B [Sphaerospermopsis aphanizomenoides]MBK1989883.1 cofactor assembly of complex C subunit B [Sphaerospermopsis aphanizomenoides BCCUSP55]